MAARQSDDSVVGMAVRTAVPYGNRISAPRIFALSVVSFALYRFYRMYRTWKQRRDHTLEKASEAAGTMRSPELYSGGVLVAGNVLSLITLIVSIVVLCVMQSNLSRYWTSVDGRLMQSARFGKGEIVCIIMGILFWLGVAYEIIWA